ncbi:MAG: hypothetical protein M0C28_38760 [Candidatus Moduliflexus flocculans]|nr:hypothetical protein [Candidatus Moduliflexus flocculans]
MTGEQVVLRAFISKDAYRGKNLETAPDIVLGFNRRLPHLLAVAARRIPQRGHRGQHPEVERRPHVGPGRPAGHRLRQPEVHGRGPGPRRPDGLRARRLRRREARPT